MAACAALVSLMHIVNDIQSHHSPPISIHRDQAQSLSKVIANLLQFIEVRSSPVTETDKADPLERRIADAAYAAEDIIESHIVNRILSTAGSQHRKNGITEFFSCFRALKKPENIPFSDDQTTLYEQLQRVIEEMESIEKLTAEISAGKAAVHDQRLNPADAPAAPSRSLTSTTRQNSITVCSDDVVDEVMDKLRSEEAGRRVIPIVGMGGIGHNSSVTEANEADPLETRIADAAYKVEDVIESHIVNRILPTDGSKHRRNGITKFFCCFRAINKPEDISLSEKGDDETTLREHLKRVIVKKESTVEMNAGKAAVHDQRLNPADTPAAPSRSFTGTTRQNSITVCSDDVINEVMDKLTSKEAGRLVIPIVGMGGIGKTTLARIIYENPLVKEHFDICTWTTISQNHNTKKILCELLSEATNQNKDDLGGKSEDELETELSQCLFSRRYLIVMDDVWSIDAWDRVQRFFRENQNGSRVLVTTRLLQLGYQLKSNYIHHMKFLDEASSWDLFSKTVFGEGRCPTELEGIGKKIVENCRGLPLSIILVGGILKEKDRSRGHWESIGENLTSVVNLENDKHCLRLLGLSYHHLPARLKPCFLYMGVFEEDFEIKVSTLIKLWIGEGFLKPINGESLETIGKVFLLELVFRNLILVHGSGSTGNIKYCKMHDLLRDFSLSEGMNSGFYHVLGEDSPQGISRQRRVVIPRNTSKTKVHDDLRAMSHVRSVIFEYGKVPLYQSLRLVRTLHAYKFRYIDDKSYVNSSAFQYVNLRHLAIEVDKTSSLFSSIGLYWNLHTLIVSCEYTSKALVDIWRMPQFRRIEFVEMRLFLPDPPSDAAVLENLHILRKVENFKFGEEAVRRLPNIKKLALRYSGGEGSEHEDYYSLTNIQKLRKLESLHINLWFDFRRVESINKLTFPRTLKKLTLSMISNFEFNDMLERIGSLPLLEKLKLWEGSFKKGEWEVVEGQFPCLKYLEILACWDLKRLTTQEGSAIFPRLEMLDLVHLGKIEGIPSEIGEIAALQKISIMKCGASVVKCVKEIVEEQVDMNGEEQVFHVRVYLGGKNEELQGLAGLNFQVFADF